MKRLQELKNDIYKCIHCKACRFAYSGEPDRKGIGRYEGKNSDFLYEGMVQACPAGIEFGWEAYWNAGKMWIARAILEGDLNFQEHGEYIADVIYPCITCGMCSAQCENQIRTVDIIEALRAAAIEAGVAPRSVHAKVKQICEKEDNPYGGKKSERTKWLEEAGIEGVLDKDAKYAYFVGCTASYRQKNVAQATARLFQKFGYDFTVLSDEVCCGSPFFRTGIVDEATRLMNHNLELFNKYDYVLFSCAGCYRTFTIDYEKWAGRENIKYKTMHAMELVSELVRQGKIKFKDNPKLEGKVVTYHDPCHTGRHYGQWFKERVIEASDNLFLDMRLVDKIVDEWFEVPRRIIKNLPDIKFNEMYRIKMDSFCCGAGGGVRSQYPEFSLKTASRRCDEANAVGADFLLTECPFCWRNLSDANEKYGHGLKVMTILEMIDKYDLIDSFDKISLDEAYREPKIEKYMPKKKKK